MYADSHTHTQKDIQELSQQFACVRDPFWGWVAGNPGWVGWETLIMRMLISSDDERNWTLCSAEDSHSHRRPLSRCLRLPSTHTHTTIQAQTLRNTHTHTYTNMHTGAFMVTLWKRGAFANNPPFLGKMASLKMLFAFLFGFALLPFLLPFCASPYSIFLHYKIYIVRVWVCVWVSVCMYVCVCVELLLWHVIQTHLPHQPPPFPPPTHRPFASFWLLCKIFVLNFCVVHEL